MTETATFGAGCFWGVEWLFRKVPGVIDAVSGYSGGGTAKPTARVVWSHRQGPDIGDQYRSVIFTETPEQEVQATASKAKAQVRFARPIATAIEPLAAFYPAEDYHQRYYEGNGHTPYCHVFPADVVASLGL